jgi:hypothetical protein
MRDIGVTGTAKVVGTEGRVLELPSEPDGLESCPNDLADAAAEVLL